MDTNRTRWTDADFETLGWHDNHVHGLSIREGEGGAGRLVLDIDYILEWRCGVDRTCRFVLAPADLAFEDVTDLVVHVDAGGVALVPLSIAEIRRQSTGDPGSTRRCRWQILFNFPRGQVSFLASGFVQQLRAAARESAEQFLCGKDRS